MKVHDERRASVQDSEFLRCVVNIFMLLVVKLFIFKTGDVQRYTF